MGSMNSDYRLCSIVIPVYKDSLDRYEELSFRQCLKILYKYRIYLVTHQHLNLSVYENLAEEYHIQIEKVFFSESYFTGIAGYNCLLKSKQFYSAFIDFDYILIYQLDAFVFRDELEKWCNQGYDYIGAPWMINDKGEMLDRSLWTVGNGGLSLRKVSHCLKVLSWKGPVIKYRKIKHLPYMLGWQNTIRYFKKSGLNEDGLFSGLLSPSYIHYDVPSPEVAAHFAFERFPSYLFDICNHQLPFGCHAFLKFEYDEFWKKYIEKDETLNYNS